MRSLTRITALAIAALLSPASVGMALALPASTAAKPRATAAPPGDSGITQYLEVVPTASGPTPPGSAGGNGAPPSVLTDAQRRRLDNLGPDGRALVAVVGETAPQSAGTAGATRPATLPGRAGARVSGPPGAGPGSAAPATRSGSSAGSAGSLILDALGGRGSGGSGLLLPAFMLTSALAAAAYAVRRRRTH